MFADMLHEARVHKGLSIAELAEKADTSRAAISDYESGRKQPRFDTAARILAALGETLTNTRAEPHPHLRWPIPTRIIDRLERARTSAEDALNQAVFDLPAVLESDAELEHLGFSWGEVKTVSDGTTISGDPLRVDRLWRLRRDARTTLHAAQAGKPESLQATGDYLVTASPGLASPARELDFLVRATAASADPARIRHLTAAALAARGYPYLWVPYQRILDYARGIVAAKLHGDGTLMLDALTAELDEGAP